MNIATIWVRNRGVIERIILPTIPKEMMVAKRVKESNSFFKSLFRLYVKMVKPILRSMAMIIINFMWYYIE